MDYSQQTKEIYNEISNRFDISRFRIWPCVKKFLDSFPSSSILLDVGCGNGKNMLYRTDLNFKGIDFSIKLVEICKNKNLDVIESSMTNIPFDNNHFDGIIVIASYHHLSNDDERKQTLDELYRVVKSGGEILIVVWAMEQPEDSKFNFTKSEELVKWYSLDNNKTFYRYYHIYSKGNLVEEIKRLKPEFNIEYEYLEKGNWVVCLKK
jgi:ubiquinone/menaquinone biosynthesis C-methylase UbiE